TILTNPMSLRVAIQMDPVESLKPATDSSIKLGLEAQNRGYSLCYYTPNTLSYENGRITARAHNLKLFDRLENFYEAGPPATLNLRDVDVILMRQDPPFDLHYITTTHLLEHLHPKPLVVNDPYHVRNAPEKLLVQYFPDYIPPTLISTDAEA